MLYILCCGMLYIYVAINILFYPLWFVHHLPQSKRYIISKTHWRDHKFPNFRSTTLNHIIRMAFDYNILCEYGRTQTKYSSFFHSRRCRFLVVQRLAFMRKTKERQCICSFVCTFRFVHPTAFIIKIFFLCPYLYSVCYKVFYGWAWRFRFHVISHRSFLSSCTLVVWWCWCDDGVVVAAAQPICWPCGSSFACLVCSLKRTAACFCIPITFCRIRWNGGNEAVSWIVDMT